MSNATGCIHPSFWSSLHSAQITPRGYFFQLRRVPSIDRLCGLPSTGRALQLTVDTSAEAIT